MTILSTRLFKPIVSKNILMRERVVALLEENQRLPLTVVVAAAGYGKSIAVSQWLETSKVRYCWISLEPDCNDLRVFLEYLITAIKNEYPDSLSKFSKIMQGLDLPPFSETIKFIINELNDLPGEFRVIFDDYHLIHNKEIHQLIDELIEFTPEGIRYTIISRHDPPLKLDSLKLYDRSFELRMTHLRFTEEEAMGYAREVLGKPIDKPSLQALTETTEGWIIGIQFILGEFGVRKNVSQPFSDFYVEKNHLTHFLKEEIFAEHALPVRKVFMLTSLLDRFSLDFMEELFALIQVDPTDEQRADFRVALEEITGSSLFIIPLDNSGEWYRYHHMIQDFLMHQCRKNFSDDQIKDLYTRASRFFKAESNLNEAVKYGLKSEDLGNVLSVVEENWDLLMYQDRFHMIKKWLELLPADWKYYSSTLLLIQAVLDDTMGNYLSMVKNLDKAEVLLRECSQEDPRLKQRWHEYYAVDAYRHYILGAFDQAIRSADKAIPFLAFPNSFLHSFALVSKGMSLVALGRGDEAVAEFEETIRRSTMNAPLAAMRNHCFLGIILTYLARLQEIKFHAEIALDLSERQGSGISVVMSEYHRTSASYLNNEPDRIVSGVDKIWELRYSGRPYWVAHALFNRVLALHALNKKQESREQMEAIGTFLRSFGNKNFDNIYYAFLVEMAIRDNAYDRAMQYSLKTSFHPHPILHSFYFPQLTEVKLHLMGGDLIKADQLLRGYAELGETKHNYNFLMQVYALQALCHEEKNKRDAALKCLEKSLNLVQEGTYARAYLDLGPKMKLLLTRLAQKENPDAKIAGLLKAFELEEQRLMAFEENPGPNEDFEALSQVETQILELVALGYQNKRIADQLCISPETVKKYLYYAYTKLGVHNRVAAINKARQLDLLSQE